MKKYVYLAEDYFLPEIFVEIYNEYHNTKILSFKGNFIGDYIGICSEKYDCIYIICSEDCPSNIADTVGQGDCEVTVEILEETFTLSENDWMGLVRAQERNPHNRIPQDAV